MKKLFIGIIIALVICTALGVVAKVATPDAISDVFRTYTVEGDVSNGVLGDISKLKAGSSVTVELSAEEGYALPETVTVTGASYEYDQAAGTLTLSNPTDNVEIEVVCVPIVWDIASTIDHCTLSGATTISMDGTASVTLTAASGYTLPSIVTVTNATLDSYTGGVVTISNPSGDVTISGACTANTYAITTSVTNATASGATTISTGGVASVTLTAALGYTLPSTVTVTNATLDSYTGGVVTISNPTGDVTISGACTANTYAVSTTLTNGTSSGATSITYGGTATVTLSANTGYALPSSVTVSGAIYTYDSTTGVVSLSAPTGNVTISGSCDQVQQQPTQTYTLTITGYFECQAGGFQPVLYVNSIAPENCYLFNGTEYANVVEGHSLPFTINGVSQIIFWLDYGCGCGTFSLNGVDYSSQMVEGDYDENNPITVVLTQNSTLNVVWGED